MPISPKSVTRFYCGNNPVNWIDPWGLRKTDIELIDYFTKKYGLSPLGRQELHQNITGRGLSKRAIEAEAKAVRAYRGKYLLKSRGGSYRPRGRGGFISKGMLKRLGLGIGVYLGYKALEWVDQEHLDLDGSPRFDISPLMSPQMRIMELPSEKLCPEKDPGDFPPLVPPGGGQYT